MRYIIIFLSLILYGFNLMVYSEQTLVFIRHGEKPDNDSGQLSCQGLNRALALPNRLITQFGQPDALFAAAPKQNKLGNSLRSLQTLTPLAVKTSLPIHLNYHAKEIDPLRNKLLSEEYQNSVIFIAWEHDNLVKVVRDIMAQFGGDPKAIPKWESGDFDSIYILKIIKEADKKKVLFEQQHQQLNDVPKQCP
ncbi:histidine phosphatase family protein [Proteus mirabilis]|uniref:histidine phosphatase family protein n=1 Tax=Proteus mirabilis TaxID=584 RepID=UPI0018C53E9D|nr:histidine phosphatase family protein [Proteus mirabilis]MBG2756408.1 histidine phosphatase family protein [Proteus mirabilis]MBG2773341.1 histidine phosphatase family protein [Proteus mirabilis]HEK0309238.1 histidine phosphatase family protein [Proteus mirabilis]